MMHVTGIPIKIINAIHRIGGVITSLEIYDSDPTIKISENKTLKIDYEKTTFSAIRCTWVNKRYRIGHLVDVNNLLVEQAINGCLTCLNEETDKFERTLLTELGVDNK